MITRTAVPEAHTHWFEIDPPSGPTSKGVCRGCGEKRIFQNRLTEEQELEAAWARPPKDYMPPVEYTNAVWW